MKKILERLGFKKADEMERSIQLKAIRLAWIYTVVFLVVWCLCESYKAKQFNESVNLMPLTLLISQNLILIFSQLFWRNHMTKGKDDGDGKNHMFIKTIAILLVIIVFIVATGILTHFILN